MSEEKNKENKTSEEQLAPEETRAQELPTKEAGKGETTKEKKKLAQLEERIHALEAEAAQKDERYLRVLAEYDNFRKRSQKEKSSTYSDAQAVAYGALLPVLDNLERAAAADGADEGIRMIVKQFEEILSKAGVTPCGKEGEAFDPNFHNAVMHAEGEGSGETVIAQVLQKGYVMGERLIRPAMVKTID